MMMMKKVFVVALCAVSTLAVASENDARAAAKEMVDLDDGSILYVFPDGKMAVESKFGRAVYTESGTILKAKDGTNIATVGNEVAKLDGLLRMEIKIKDGHWHGHDRR